MKKNQPFNDFILWKKLLEGDINSLKIIYDLYINDLYNYGKRFTSDDELIKDCIHDIFIEVYKKRRNLSYTNNILYYLLKSLRRKIFKELSKKTKRIIVDEDYKFNYLEYIDSFQKIEDSEKNKLIKQKIRTAINSLTSRQREALYLKYIFEMEYEDICEIMNMNYQSIRNLVCRALNSLREILNDKQFDDNL